VTSGSRSPCDDLYKTYSDADIQGIRRKEQKKATLGRRRANATYFASHETDTTSGTNFAMDISRW
jgi:hypothetical protein